MSVASYIQTVIFGAVLAAVGGFLVHLTLPSLLQARASTSWPVVPGRVTVSDVKASPVIQYAYTVDNRALHGSTVWLHDGQSAFDPTDLELVGRYPEGKQVKVHYDPDSPSDSVLEPGASPGTYFMPLLGSAVIGVGLLIIALPVVKSVMVRLRLGGLYGAWRQLTLGTIFGAVGLALIWYGLWVRAQALAYAAWPSVPGAVAVSRLSLYKNSDGTMVFPVVEVAYTVDGQPLKCGDIAGYTASGSTTEAAAQQVLERYPVGREVPVYYDPAAPYRAVLERDGVPGQAYVIVLAGVPFLLVGLLVVAAQFWRIVRGPAY